MHRNKDWDEELGHDDGYEYEEDAYAEPPEEEDEEEDDD